ncbi:cell division protein ZapA [Allosphingosinicella flava]|uniref:Cell division protein ZapA n=1 Tax=Allosphingosinicella flava TaxID=2771430 RepID=A0A7T2GKF6_9SPHN|nr:cell division protein ZapA [Sphingosinicella flava]QPQ55491.1 cell division protein ZapA [Sphingosinicella flava]
MASVEIQVATRKYQIACRDGEEEHIRMVGALVDQKAKEAGSALGSLPEARQLLFASLLLADEIKELRAGRMPPAPPPPPPAAPDPAIAEALERLAVRMESLADRLEDKTATS